jgi:hypothetical protein
MSIYRTPQHHPIAIQMDLVTLISTSTVTQTLTSTPSSITPTTMVVTHRGAMRRPTGFDLFRNQEQERLQHDNTVRFKLSIHMPLFATKWKNLNEADRLVFKSKASECEMVPSKSHARKRTRNPESEPTRTIKRKRKRRDPILPKRPLSAFIFFSCERRKTIILEHPNMKPNDCLKCLGAEWKQVTDKRPYQTLAIMDKTRYTDELAAHRASVSFVIVEPMRVYKSMGPNRNMNSIDP